MFGTRSSLRSVAARVALASRQRLPSSSASSPSSVLLGGFRPPRRPIQEPLVRCFETAACLPLDEDDPGAIAFADIDVAALEDAYGRFADPNGHISRENTKLLLESIGEELEGNCLNKLFQEAARGGDMITSLDDLLSAADDVLGDAASRIILVVGGPSSGKTILCDKLASDCTAVHLCARDLVRDEVQRQTPLGMEIGHQSRVRDHASGSAILALVRRRMRSHPGVKCLLTGFPRSLEDTRDFVELMGQPELAVHLQCDDTILLAREIERTDVPMPGNLDHAITKLRKFKQHHTATMGLLREEHVPIVNLDCTGSKENVWEQLLAIGRLMRPATQRAMPRDEEVRALFG